MKSVSKDLINELQSVNTVPCVSIYMPAHRTHPDNQQDPLVYKKLCRQVEDSLKKSYGEEEISRIMRPLYTLADDRNFWNQTPSGLAIFGSCDFFQVAGLHLPVPELSIVADSFHIKPLRQYLQTTDRYQVIGINQKRVRIFEGDRFHLLEVELDPDVPATIEDALGRELTEPHMTVASYGGVGAGSAKMVHGHGTRKDEIDKDTERFFRVVGEKIYRYHSKPSGLPLILASLPEYHHLFHQVSQNPQLLETSISIDPEGVSVDKLNEMAWQILQPTLSAKMDKWKNDVMTAMANKKGSDDIREISKAAAEGKVASLFLEKNKMISGRIMDPARGTTKKSKPDNPETDDLLDDLGELVAERGGEVYVIPKEHMASASGVSAIYRY